MARANNNVTTHRWVYLASLLTLPGCALGTWEIMMIFGIVVLLFGATRLPQLGRALGETIRGFKQGLDKGDDEPNKVLPPADNAPVASEKQSDESKV